MGAKSEFEIILDKLLRPTSSFAKISEPSHSEIKMDFSQINFSFGPLGQKVFSKVAAENYRSHYVEKEEKIELAIKTKQAAEPKVQVPPKKRVQRKLNFDQSRALTVFVRFGESKVDDYSTDDEIKSAYRRLARKFHPDLNKNGAEDFKIISLAFQKLIP